MTIRNRGNKKNDGLMPNAKFANIKRRYIWYLMKESM